MTTLERFGYTVEVDEDATRTWYAQAKSWDCDCAYCLNFLLLAQRRELPAELLEVLDKLSIPPEKATQVCEYGWEDSGRPYYQINYRLVGRIISAPETEPGTVRFAEKDGYPYPTDFPPPDFDILCFTALPWVLPCPHQILFSSDLEEDTTEAEALLREVIPAALRCEGLEDVPCEISVLLTGDEGIRTVNREQRAVDAPTDVLSFPMFDLQPGDKPSPEDADPDGLVPLGDMALNLDRARVQGEEYGHGFRRELAYLAVHSVLHLLGYDHMDDGPMKAQMREREEFILHTLGIDRDIAERKFAL